VIQRNLDDGRQAMAQHRRQLVGAQDGNLSLDQPRVPQALDPPQAGGRRYVNLRGQVLVADGRVRLQRIEQAQVGIVDID